LTPARLDRIRLAADGPGVTDEMVDDLLAEIDRLRSELHDANVAAVVAAMLRQNTIKKRDALRAAGDGMAQWLEVWTTRHPEAHYSIAALQAWRAVVGRAEGE
jgi:hypothetical protein